MFSRNYSKQKQFFFFKPSRFLKHMGEMCIFENTATREELGKSAPLLLVRKNSTCSRGVEWFNSFIAASLKGALILGGFTFQVLVLSSFLIR